MITGKYLRAHRFIIIISILAVAFGLVTSVAIHLRKPQLLTESNFQLPIDATPNITSDSKPGLPIKIEIPKISVSSNIEHISVTPEGDLDTPKAYENGGWYKNGPRPGESGSAVIGGHYGRANNQPAIFDNLHQLEKGDQLSITDAEGAKITFVVSGSRLYLANEDASAVYRSGTGTMRLNLITCQGRWDDGQESYTSRLVVFSERI